METTIQFIRNALWAEWISPVQFGSFTTASSETEQQLYNWQPLLECSTSVLDMLQAKFQHELNLNSGMEDESNDMSYFGKLNLEVLCQFVGFTLQVLCHVQEWEKLVDTAERLHELSNALYSEEVLPLAIHAQQQRWKIQTSLVDEQQGKINDFLHKFEEQKKKNSKRKARLVFEQGEKPAPMVHVPVSSLSSPVRGRARFQSTEE